MTKRPTPRTAKSLRPSFLLACVLALTAAGSADGFCGFYVAKADTELFNQASKVVLVRDGDRTVITMANDFKGEPDEFAVVIPVPTFLEREQIHVGNRAVIDHLDAYSAPRLVEYYDEDPCQRFLRREMEMARKSAAAPMPSAAVQEDRSLGVTVEAEYSVGEYDIQILSAEESSGLETWLRRSGYRLPEGASRVLGSYIRQEMRFFVAKVNLETQAKLGYRFLRPLQVAYESPKFMLPIRLGTVNADGPQELYVFALTRTGRVETTNYRTVRLPSDVEIPVFVKDSFAEFYRDMFARQVERQERAVFLEYAWDMAWCDPCAADPLSTTELRELGVFWVGGEDRRGSARRAPVQQAQNVFVTRLHLRYNRRDLSRGSVLPGDRRSAELPRTVHLAPTPGKAGRAAKPPAATSRPCRNVSPGRLGPSPISPAGPWPRSGSAREPWLRRSTTAHGGRSCGATGELPLGKRHPCQARGSRDTGSGVRFSSPFSPRP